MKKSGKEKAKNMDTRKEFEKYFFRKILCHQILELSSQVSIFSDAVIKSYSLFPKVEKISYSKHTLIRAKEEGHCQL